MVLEKLKVHLLSLWVIVLLQSKNCNYVAEWLSKLTLSIASDVGNCTIFFPFFTVLRRCIKISTEEAGCHISRQFKDGLAQWTAFFTLLFGLNLTLLKKIWENWDKVSPDVGIGAICSPFPLNSIRGWCSKNKITLFLTNKYNSN